MKNKIIICISSVLILAMILLSANYKSSSYDLDLSEVLKENDNYFIQYMYSNDFDKKYDNIYYTSVDFYDNEYKELFVTYSDSKSKVVHEEIWGYDEVLDSVVVFSSLEKDLDTTKSIEYSYFYPMNILMVSVIYNDGTSSHQYIDTRNNCIIAKNDDSGYYLYSYSNNSYDSVNKEEYDNMINVIAPRDNYYNISTDYLTRATNKSLINL